MQSLSHLAGNTKEPDECTSNRRNKLRARNDKFGAGVQVYETSHELILRRLIVIE